MTIKQDNEDFDRHQRRLLEEVALTVKECLQNAGLEKESGLAEDIVFKIAAIIDASAEMIIDEKPLIPFLTFASDEGTRTLIAPAGRGSWMHEYACGVVERIFSEES